MSKYLKKNVNLPLSLNKLIGLINRVAKPRDYIKDLPEATLLYDHLESEGLLDDNQVAKWLEAIPDNNILLAMGSTREANVVWPRLKWIKSIKGWHDFKEIGLTINVVISVSKKTILGIH